MIELSDKIDIDYDAGQIILRICFLNAGDEVENIPNGLFEPDAFKLELERFPHGHDREIWTEGTIVHTNWEKPVREMFEKLKPGESRKLQIDLNERFGITLPGKYGVKIVYDITNLKIETQTIKLPPYKVWFELKQPLILSEMAKAYKKSAKWDNSLLGKILSKIFGMF